MGGSIRAEELPGLPDDRKFSFKLTDLPVGGAQFDRLDGGPPWDLSTVDQVLFKPSVQTIGTDAELIGGLFHLLARPDQRDRASSELGRIGTRHGQSLSFRPSTHHQTWNPNRGAGHFLREIATCAWVSWFNEERLHSEFGDRTPLELEAEYRDLDQAKVA